MPRLHQIIAIALAQSENLQDKSKGTPLPNGLIVVADCTGSKRKLFFVRDPSDKYCPRTDDQKAKMLSEVKIAVKFAPFPVLEPQKVKIPQGVGFVFLEADSVPVQDNEGTVRLMSLEDKARADAATAVFSDRIFARRVEDAVNLMFELFPQHPDCVDSRRELWRDGFAQFPQHLEARILEMQMKLESQKKVVPAVQKTNFNEVLI
jgi:hypothetical protein